MPHKPHYHFGSSSRSNTHRSFYPPSDTIHSVPIMIHHSPPQGLSFTFVDNEETACPLLKIVQDTICTWVCVDDVLGLFLSWSKYGNYGLIEWNIVNIFSSVEKSHFFTTLHKNAAFNIHDNCDIFSQLSLVDSIYRMYALFIPYSSGSLPPWMTTVINCIYLVACANNCCYQCKLWIPKAFYPSTIIPH